MMENKVPPALSAAMLLALTLHSHAMPLDTPSFEALQRQADRAASVAEPPAQAGPGQHLAQWYNFNNWSNWANACVNDTWRNC